MLIGMSILLQLEKRSPSSPPEVTPRPPVRQKSITLPPGWKKCQDAESGRPYYFNADTQESMWKPPRISKSEEGTLNEV